MSYYDDDDDEVAVRHRTVRRRDPKPHRVVRSRGGKPGVAFADDALENGRSIRTGHPFPPARYGSGFDYYRDLDEDQRHLPLRATDMPVVDRSQPFYAPYPVRPYSVRPSPPPPPVVRDLRSRSQNYRPPDKPLYTIGDVPPPPGLGPRPRERSPTSHGPSSFQALCNTDEPQNVSIHLELPVSEDFEAGLEEFSRLKRLGNFKGAKDYFKDNLEAYIGHPYVFVQYAEMLLAMADFQSFGLLDAEPVFGNDTSSGYSSSSDEEDDGYPVTHGRGRVPPPPSSSRRRQEESGGRSRQRSSSWPRAGLNRNERKTDTYPRIARSQSADSSDDVVEDGEFELLERNWGLLEALAGIFRDGTIDGAVEQVESTIAIFQFKPTMGSTEIQIVSLVLHLVAHITRCDGPHHHDLEHEVEVWIDWLQLYDNLQADGRIWDFRDIFMAFTAAFGSQQACEMFFGTQNWRDHIPGDWELDEKDESTTIACLDILMSVVFADPVVEYGVPGEKVNRLLEYLHHAGPLAENLMKHYPESMRSRPFAQWILAKAAESGCKREQRLPKPHFEPFHYVWCFEGLNFRESEWAGFPTYAPFSAENPGWQVPQTPQEDLEPMYMALKVAKELQDYQTQVLCYKMLILRSQDPLLLFEELTHLQKTSQGDNRGYLRTLVTKYLACKDRLSRIQLLDELKSTDDCLEDSVIRDPQVYCARDFIQRTLALQVGGRGSSAPLRKSGIAAYRFLPDYVNHFLKKALRRDVLPPGYGFPQPVSSRRGHRYHSHPDDPYFEYAVRPAPPQAPPAPPRAKSSQPKDKIATVLRQRTVEGPFIPGGPTPPPPSDPNAPDPRIVNIVKPTPPSPTLPQPSGIQRDDDNRNENRALIPYNPVLSQQWSALRHPKASDEVQRPEVPKRGSSPVHNDSSTESDGASDAFAKLSKGADKVGGPEQLDLDRQKEEVSKLRRRLRQERQNCDTRRESLDNAESELQATMSDFERCEAELLRMEENAKQVGEAKTKEKGKGTETSELTNSTGYVEYIRDDDPVWVLDRRTKIQPISKTSQDTVPAENRATRDMELESSQASGSKLQAEDNSRAGFKTRQAPEEAKGKEVPFETFWNEGAKVRTEEDVKSRQQRAVHLGPTPNYENEREANLDAEKHTNDTRATQSAKTHDRQNKSPATPRSGMNVAEASAAASVAAAAAAATAAADVVAAQNERIARRVAPMRPNRYKLSDKPADNKDAAAGGSQGEVAKEATDWDNLAAEQRVEIATRMSEGRDNDPARGWGSTGVWDGWDEISRRKPHRRIAGRPKVIVQEVGTFSPTLHRKRGDIRLMYRDRASSSLPEERAGASSRPLSGDIDPDVYFSGRRNPVQRFVATGDRDGEEADNEEAGENNLGNRALRGKRGESMALDARDTKQEDQGKEREFQNGERRTQSLKMAEASHLAAGGSGAMAGEQSKSDDGRMSTKPDPLSEPEQTISRRPTVTDPTPGDD